MSKQRNPSASIAGPALLLSLGALLLVLCLGGWRAEGPNGLSLLVLAAGLAIIALSIPWLRSRSRQRARVRALRRGIVEARARAVHEREHQMRQRVLLEFGDLEQTPLEEDRYELRQLIPTLDPQAAVARVLRHELWMLEFDGPEWRQVLNNPAEAEWGTPATRTALIDARGRLDAIHLLLDAVQAAKNTGPAHGNFLVRDALRLWREAEEPSDAHVATAPRRPAGTTDTTSTAALLPSTTGHGADHPSQHWFDQDLPSDPACVPLGEPATGSPTAWCDSSAWGSPAGHSALSGDSSSFSSDSGFSDWGGGGDGGGSDGGGGGGGGGD